MKRSSPYPTFRYWLNDESGERVPINAESSGIADGLSAVALPADGQILIGSSIGDPVAGTITAGAGITVTNNPGAVEIATTTGALTLTDGQVAIGSTGTDPVAATLTAGNGISVTNGAGSITIGNELGGVSITGAANGDYLRHNGAEWVNYPIPMGSLYWRDNYTETEILLQKNIMHDNSNFYKVNGVSVPKTQTLFTASTDGRLTYTGTQTRHAHIVCQFSARGGNDKIYFFTIVKNGVTYDNVILQQNLHGDRVNSAAIHTDMMMDTGDYIELFIANTENDDNAIVNSMYMFAMLM